jgi:hypothetical protein
MELTGRIIKKGKVSGEALVTSQPISFFGGTDPDKGILTEKGHELEGKSFAGKVLVFPQGKGSTVGSYALYRLKKNNVAPLAMINKECEPIVAVGAIISDIPCVDKIDITQINTGDLIEIEDGKITITKKV